MKIATLLSKLGPGLLYTGAAVGVSHLVQSTRAGANYGWLMIAVVILANGLKYPFFKFGPQYAAATGKSLLEGFRQMGKWTLIIFLFITITTMFTVQAAVTLITASITAFIFGIGTPLWIISAAILMLCLLILILGRYSLLDRMMKAVIFLLTITTITTLFLAWRYAPVLGNLPQAFSFADTKDVLFLIALVGWMPAPLDISIWHSEWTLEKAKEKGAGRDLKNSLFDFKVGYWGTTFLAVCFVSLGTMLFYGGQEALSPKGTVFAGQLIGMYTKMIGSWAYPIIAIAALTTMFSTTLTVFDAFPRVLTKSLKLMGAKEQVAQKSNSKAYWLWLIILYMGTLFILLYQLENMRQLIDFATSVSFLTAPILAIMIYSLMNKKRNPESVRPNQLEHALSWLGILFLIGFSLYYLLA